MGLLNAVIQNEGMNRQLPGKFAEQTKKIIDRKRLSQLGNAFDEWPDKSAGGIEKFVKASGASLPEANALVKMYAGFKKNQRDIAAPTEMQNIYGPEGGTQRVPVQKGTAYTPPEKWSLKPPGTGSNTEMQNIYGPKNSTMRVPVTKGKEYTPPENWSLSKPTAGKSLTAGQARENYYKEYLDSNDLTRSQYPIWKFNNEVWNPKTTGELTDGAVLQNIREMALYLDLPADVDPETKSTEMFGSYLKYKKSGMDRADALNKVQQESAASKKSILRTGTHNGRKVIKYSDGSIEYAD